MKMTKVETKIYKRLMKHLEHELNKPARQINQGGGGMQNMDSMQPLNVRDMSMAAINFMNVLKLKNSKDDTLAKASRLEEGDLD